MKIGIVGPGAIGCLFSARLLEGGKEVVLIDYKQDRAHLLNERGIILERGGVESVHKVSCSAEPSSAAGLDGIIFTVKAYQTRNAAERLRETLDAGAWVLTLQNGMGNIETLLEIFGAGRVLAGTTSEGATMKGPGSVRHAGNGETSLGELTGETSERVESIAGIFNGAGITARVSSNVTSLLWKKLLVNVGINPVTALLRIKNGELLERESALEVSSAAVLEAAAVAAAEGIQLSDVKPVELVKDVARRTAENISSMHQDVAAGRTTEIEFICGHVVRTAAKHGIPTPFNKALNDLVSALASDGNEGLLRE